MNHREPHPQPRRQARSGPTAPPAPAAERVQAAVELLAQELRARLASHPAGHLLHGRGGALELSLRLPLSPRDGDLERAGRAATAELENELAAILSRQATFRPGRVFCLRCGTAACEHAAPATCREVFTGYGPSGLPRFQDFPAWLLAHADAVVDRLYEDPALFVSRVVGEATLTADLLPAFRDQATDFRLHGEVVAGWYRGSDRDGLPASLAVSFQVVSTRSPRGQRLYGLNLVAVGPGGEPLEAFCGRLGEVPWAGPVRWAQQVLAQIGEAATGRGRDARERRIEGLLLGLAARLEKDRRAEGRRTKHASQRHRQGDRPTRMAIADLARALPEQLLIDDRRDTVVVLGERGRAHIWSRAGKLVTSVRYSPEAIERRRKEGFWRPARGEEVSALRAEVAGHGE